VHVQIGQARGAREAVAALVEAQRVWRDLSARSGVQYRELLGRLVVRELVRDGIAP